MLVTLVLLCFGFNYYSSTNTVHAATGINHKINFQGKLVNTDGTNVTDGSYSIVFTIYDAASAGTNLWNETQSVTVSNGIFQVNLGSVTTLPASIDFNTDNIYLGIKVGADAEMTPRIQFTAVPQAFNSEKLGGLDKTGFIQNQTGSAQAASFNINGTAQVGTSVTTPLLQAAAATALTITGNAASTWSTSAGNITLQAGSGTISLGSTTTLSSTGALTITGGSTLTLTSTGANAISLDSGTTGGVNIGTNANAKTITIGNNTGGTSVVIDCGTGACNFGTTATAHATTVGSNTAGSTTTLQAAGGSVAVANTGVTVSSSLKIGTTANQQVSISSGAGNHGIEIGRTDSVASTPFLDFHSGTTGGNDYDSRIIASGGTASAGGGTLTFQAATSAISGNATVGGTLSVTGAGGSADIQLTNGGIYARRDTNGTTVSASNALLSLENGDSTANNMVPIRFLARDTSAAIHNSAFIAEQTTARAAATTTADLIFGTSNASAGAVETARLTGAGRLQLAIQGSAGGIQLGGDSLANIYRASAGVLQTDGDFQTGGDLAVNGGDITTSATTFNLLNTVATTLNFGGAATTLNIGPGAATATSINLAGGSAATGCTVDGATGNLTCSGNIVGSATGTAGFFSRSGTVLQPATAGDSITTSGSLSTTGAGTITSAGLLTASAGITTVGASGANIVNVNTSTNLASDTAYEAFVSGRAQIGYDGSRGSLALRTTSGGKPITFDINNVETERIDTLGNFGIQTTAPSGLLDVAQSNTGPGTVTTNATTTLTGSGTQFTSTFKVGDTITVSGETVRTITAIGSNTSLTVSVAFSTTAGGLSYTLSGGSRLVVLGNGNVGIGTTAPGAYKLNVQGGDVNLSGNLAVGTTTVLTSGRVLQNILGYTQSSGNATFNQNAADQLKVVALQAPTSDMVNISNSGFPITTDQINGEQIDYYANLGNAAFQAAGLRVNITNTSATAGSTTSGLRVVATANVAGNTNGIKIDNITSGAGTDVGLLVGTGWDNGISINSGGNLIKATSTTALDIQDAGGVSMLTADTSSRVLTLNQGNIYVAGFGTPATPAIAAGSNQGGTLSGAAGTTYFYKRTIVGPSGESVPSAEASIAATSFTPLTAPGAATVAAPSAGGAVTLGTHSYKVTFVTANGETTGGTTSTQVNVTTGGTQTVALSAIPTGPAGTTQRKIYRTVTGDAGSYLLLTTIADNVTTVFSDTIADASLGAAAPGVNNARTNTNNATVTFSTVTGASSYRIYRGTATNAESAYQSTASSPFTDTGAAGTAASTPTASTVEQVGIGTSTPSANLDVRGTVFLQNAINTTSAFQLQNAAGTSIFNVDTTNSKIGTINTTAASTNSAVLTIKSGDASGVTSNSGDVILDSGTATGTAGNITIGTGAYAHNVTIGNTTGSSAVTLQAGTGNLNLNGATILGNATTQNLFNTVATTINLGGAAATFNIGPGAATAASINLAGGSAATGCTVDGATGNLTCSGNISGNAAGTVGYFSRSGTVLQPATAGDSITTSGSLSTTGAGTITAAGILNANATGKTAITIADSGAQNSGITIGGDTNLYRSAANTLQTDDSFVIKTTTDSDNALQVMQSGGRAILTVNTNVGTGTIIDNSMHALGDNQIENPGFELSKTGSLATANATGWQGTGTIVAGSAIARTGNNYLSMTPTGANVGLNEMKWHAVTPGERLYVEAWVKTAAGTNGTGGFYLDFADKDLSNVSTSSTVIAANTSWTLASNTITASTTACGGNPCTYVRVNPLISSSSTTGTWYYDDFYMNRMTDQTPMIYKNSVDSTTAFQIQNAVGYSMLTANTTNNQINLGAPVNVNGILSPTATLATTTTTGTLAANTYFYRIASELDGARTAAIATTPASVTTTGTTSKNTLTWTPITGATGYYVYRSTGGNVWYRNYVAGQATSTLIDNGSTYTWSGTNYSNDSNFNSTSSVYINNNGYLALDASGNTLLALNARTNELTLGNYWVGGDMVLQGDAFVVQDTTGYNNNLTIDNTGAAVFKNRVDSGSAFQIQSATGKIALNVSTNDTGGTNALLQVGGTGYTTSELSLMKGAAYKWDLGFDSSGPGGTDGLYVYNETSSSYNFGLSTTGQATFKNSSDNTSAFKVQDASGKDILNVVTSGASYLINNGTKQLGNELENPGFETDGPTNDASGWRLGAPAVITNDPANARSGNRYMGVPQTVGGTDTAETKFYAVVPGQEIEAEAWVKTTSPSGQGGLYIQWWDKDFSAFSFTNGDWTNPGGTYTLKTIRATVPAGKYYMRLTTTVRAQAGPSGTWYFDDANLNINTQTNPLVLQNSVDSTTAFQVQNAAGNVLLSADTTNSNIKLTSGTGAAQYDVLTLDRNSAANRKLQIRFNQQGAPRYSLGMDLSGTNAQNFYLYDDVAGIDRFVVDANGQFGLGTGATVAADLHIKRTGDATIKLEADTDNVNEADNATIFLSQDAGGHTGQIGMEGTAGQTFTGSVADAMYFGTTTDDAVQIIQGGQAAQTINSNGAVTFKNSTDSNIAFQVQNTAGASALTTNTTNLSTTVGGSLNVTGLGNPVATLASSGVGGTLAANTYYYRISSIGAAGESAAVYTTPQSVTTAGSTSSNTVTWSAITGATGYKLYRSTNNSTWFVNTLGAVTTAVDNGTNFTWGTGGAPSSYNSTNIQMTSGGGIYFDNTDNAYIRYNPNNSSVQISNYNAAGNMAFNSTSFGFYDTAGNNSLFLASNGSATFKEISDTTTAFRVQNAAGATILNIDTTINEVTVNGNNSAELSSWATSSNPLPAVNFEAASVIANGYIYNFGGTPTGFAAPTANFYYAKLNADGTTGSWTLGTMPGARLYHGAVTVNGYVYIIGGYDGSVYTGTVFRGKLNADGSISNWVTLTSTPLPAVRGNAATVTTNGYIYVIGGFDTAIRGTVYYAKVNADGSLSSWTTSVNDLGTTTNIRSSAAAAVANGYVYVIGGAQTGATATNTVFSASLNPTTGAPGTFAQVGGSGGTMNTAAIENTSVVANGYLYSIGGVTNVTQYSKIGANGALGAWTTAAKSFPGAGLAAYRTSHTSGIYNGNIYVLGGTDGSNAVQSTVYYASTERLQVGGTLDLVGLGGGTLSDMAMSSGMGNMGGELIAGNTSVAGTLEVLGQATMMKSLSVGGSLTVGGAGANSTTAFQVQNTAGTAILNVDTQSSILEVNGDLYSDGIKWVSHAGSANNTWTSVAYGNGQFVSVSSGGTNRVMTSPDGVNWTARTSAVETNNWTSVTYGNGIFVAVSSTGSGNRVMTSTDGITWTTRTSAADNSWSSVTYGKGLFVAVAFSGSGNRVMTSPDGVNWTIQTSAGNFGWNSVTYGNGIYVAVANSTAGNRVMTSTDGVTWALSASVDDTQSWNSVTYGNGTFVAVASNTTKVMTSTNGTAWTQRTGAVANGWNNVSYGGGLFVAVSFNGTGNRVMTSPDGITWTSRASAADVSWGASTYGNGMFVAVAGSCAANCVMTSGKTDLSVVAYDNISQGGISVYGNAKFQSDSNSTTAFKVQNATGTSLLNVDTSTSALTLSGSVGGNVVSDIRAAETVAATYTESTAGLAYHLSADSTTTNTPFTTTYNITGLPSVDGTFAFIISTAKKGATAGAVAHTVAVQINGTPISSVATVSGVGASQVSEDYIIMRVNGTWRIVAYGNANTTLGTTSDTADLAEWIHYDGTMPQAGDVLTVGSGVSAKLSDAAYDMGLIGVVTTTPHSVMGADDGHSVKMALTGRVPVKISLENGPIKAGDYLTSSSTPGYAMKATKPGNILGKALEDFSGNNGDTVMMQLQSGYADPRSEAEQLQSDMNVGGSLNVAGNVNIGGELIVTGSAHIGGNLTVVGSVSAQTLTVTGSTSVVDITVNGHIITAGNAPQTEAMAALGQNAIFNVDGNDSAGTLTITTGTTGLSTGDIGKLTFTKTFTKTPRIIMSPQDDTSEQARIFPSSKSAASFSLKTGQTLAPNTTYTFDYVIVE